MIALCHSFGKSALALCPLCLRPAQIDDAGEAGSGAAGSRHALFVMPDTESVLGCGRICSKNGLRSETQCPG